MTVDPKELERLARKADPRVGEVIFDESAHEFWACDVRTGDWLWGADFPGGRAQQAMLAALRALADEPDPAVDQAHEAGYAKAIADVRVWLMTDAVDPAFAESDIPYLDGERLCSEFADMLRAGMHRGASDDSGANGVGDE